MSTKDTGRLGEDIAARFLAKKGFTIVEINYRKAWGEIDIIAEKDGIVRFVEVKAVSRAAGQHGSHETKYLPEEQVHPKKLEKLQRTAETYMSNKKDQREYQIDVVGVILDHQQRRAHCRLWEQVL